MYIYIFLHTRPLKTRLDKTRIHNRIFRSRIESVKRNIDTYTWSHHLLVILFYTWSHHLFVYCLYFADISTVMIHWCRANVTPNRKRSTEEKRTAIASSLITIPDATPVMTGLTESSSSGLYPSSLIFFLKIKIITYVINRPQWLLHFISLISL